MLRIIQNSAAAGAKSYYSTADYYTEGKEPIGIWRGEGAKLLGLEGPIAKSDWDALCDNRRPGTDETLTARQKSNRRVGYDFNFHVPKSVSLFYGLTRDERVLDAFDSAVEATMRDMEAETKTRVRAGGSNQDRTTTNMVWGKFVHFTARPVGGIPDPHLHAHCFVFNVTWDESESRWKAAQLGDIKSEAPYFEAAFHSRLSQALEAKGLRVERTGKGWELAGVPAHTLRTFSRRSALIEAKAREKGLTDPDRKGELGATTREHKRVDLTMDELRREWRSRLTADDAAAIEAIGNGRVREPLGPEEATVARDALGYALRHYLERRAVVSERALLAEAMRRSYGTTSLDALKHELGTLDVLRATHRGERVVTTKAILAEERAMIAFARGGRGACAPLGVGKHEYSAAWLSAEQRAAVEHVLSSKDRVVLVRGGAGTGKTSMMREAVAGIEACGHRVLVVAPSADASRGVLREAGFAEADTLARLLLDERMQAQARGGAIWVDEAGMVGNRTMSKLFDLAERLHARVILSGDPGQHGPVDRGAALRLLEDEAGLTPARLKDIRRQCGAYKGAVALLAGGRAADALEQLDSLGWLRVAPDDTRGHLLASDYVATVKSGKTALVVSPTHREADAITADIRAALRKAGELGGDEHRIFTLANANLTEAERGDARCYSPGDVLVFHQNAKGFDNAQRYQVGDVLPPLSQAARFQVFRPGLISVAAGDVLRVTHNGRTKDGKHRLNNGQLVKVKSFTRDGDLVLRNGWVVGKEFGHLSYGYVVTSYASQGKTVDRVFIGQSSISAPAASREQLYVSASRGREQAVIYTDDKGALLEAAKRMEDRLTATALDRERREHVRRQQAREQSRRRERAQVAEHVR